MNNICSRKSEPVTVGSFSFYCEHFKVIACTDVAEQSVASGATVVTNRNQRSTKIVFNGRIHNDNILSCFGDVINRMSIERRYKINYRNFIFNNCIITGLIVEDKGDDFAYITLTVVTPSLILRSDI